QVPKKSKRHKANEKNEIPSSPKTSSSDSYINININKNSVVVDEKTEEVENIDEQVGIDDLAKLEEQLKKQPYTE
ncbi:4463_t:CDS:1, partial [Paraglomus occultum]